MIQKQNWLNVLSPTSKQRLLVTVLFLMMVQCQFLNGQEDGAEAILPTNTSLIIKLNSVADLIHSMEIEAIEIRESDEWKAFSIGLANSSVGKPVKLIENLFEIGVELSKLDNV